MTLINLLNFIKSPSVSLASVGLDWYIFIMDWDYCILSCPVGENAFFLSLSSDNFHRADHWMKNIVSALLKLR